MPAASTQVPAASAKVIAAGAVLLALVAAILIFNPGSGDNTLLETSTADDTSSTSVDDLAPPALSVAADEVQEPTESDASAGPDTPTPGPASETAAPPDPADPASAPASASASADTDAVETPAPAPAVEPAAVGASTEAYEAIRNRQDRFSRYGTVPSDQLDLGALTEPAPRADNGPSPEGQFRVACEYSHFGSDDPIIFPGQPGASHLHMFFGNTLTNAFTTDDELLNRGGGTCSGFELNRSAYWTPALLDGNGNTIVPDAIILYYKTKFPGEVSPMPQGLQMLAGNFDSESFTASDRLHWSCGGSGAAYNKTNRIPDCGGDYVNATIQFPSCWDGVNLGASDFVSHLDFGSDHEPCPTSHPVRLPRISILLYYPGVGSVDGWHLSSDNTGGYNGPPGGTLHADWWGAWHDPAMELWIDGCMRASRNCSFGQTGTSVQLAGVSDRDVYEGENFLPLP